MHTFCPSQHPLYRCCVICCNFIFLLLSFKINLLILISLIVQTVGPASARARLAPANIVEWNGDVCVRNKITTFAAPIYLLKCTISGVTEKSQWRQNDLNPRIFAKAGERQMKSPDVDNILEDRNKTESRFKKNNNCVLFLVDSVCCCSERRGRRP